MHQVEGFGGGREVPPLQVTSVVPGEGVTVNLYRATGKATCRQTMTSEERQLRFSFMLRGSAEAEIQGLCISPELGSGRIGYAPGRPMSFVHSEDFIQIEVAVDLSSLQKMVGSEFDKVANGIHSGLVSSVSRSPILNRSANMLLQRVEGEEALLLQYAASLEFIGGHLDGLGDNRKVNRKLPDYERRCLHLARDFLLADLTKSPTIPELALTVGLNQLKLKTGFKYLFGDSIYAYFQKHRMAKAHQLLRSSSVTETASRLGYTNLSHFSAAFKKHRGDLPSQIRQEFVNTD